MIVIKNITIIFGYILVLKIFYKIIFFYSLIYYININTLFFILLKIKI